MWLDRAVKWLLPREEHFFDLLERGAACAANSGKLLVACCAAAPADRDALIAQMTDEEHAADRVIHEVYEALNKTFVTPLDRSDIYKLATDLEEITDRANATLRQILVHAMDELPPGSAEIAAMVASACNEIEGAVKLLRKLEKLDDIRACCTAINKLEHDGDQVFRANIGALFRTQKDAVQLIRHKEFLEGLERTLDACDDVANALEALVIKNA